MTDQKQIIIEALETELARISKISIHYSKQDISRDPVNMTRYSDEGLTVTNALYDAEKAIKAAIAALQVKVVKI